MVKLLLVMAFVATVFSLSSAGIPRHNPAPEPYINRPRPPVPRFRREANPQKNSVSVNVDKPLSGPERRPSYNVDYQHKFFENKNGHISAGGGVQKFPGQKIQPHVGVQGTWRFKREANPQKNSVSVNVDKPLSGPERRPSYNVDYQHKFFENKNGHISAGGGVQKFPGQKIQPHVGVQGTWRFKREANPQGGSVNVGVNKPLNGPERRPSYNIDYQHNIYSGKNGQISAGGGAVKNPGQKWQPHVGVQGTWRFRREANPQKNSVSVNVDKPLSGPERRPSYNVDYQHKFFENKNGHISAGGGIQKFPGQKIQPHVGVQGTWRFKREANPQGGSVNVGVNKPLSGPERRPSYNIDYQHNIYSGKNGQISAGGGAVKHPGQKWQPQVGVQGTWRF